MANPRPCPFCHCAAAKLAKLIASYDMYYVSCPNCEAHGPLALTEPDAIHWWNRHSEEGPPTP